MHQGAFTRIDSNYWNLSWIWDNLKLSWTFFLGWCQLKWIRHFGHVFFKLRLFLRLWLTSFSSVDQSTSLECFFIMPFRWEILCICSTLVRDFEVFSMQRKGLLKQILGLDVNSGCADLSFVIVYCVLLRPNLNSTV